MEWSLCSALLKSAPGLESSHVFRTLIEYAFIALQSWIVLFLALHDWVPLGRLNNNAGKRREDPFFHLLLTTLVAAVPALVCLCYSIEYFGRAYPFWVDCWFLITYGLFAIGLLRAWWVPYLMLPDERRAARYKTIFADTHAFLPARNGIVPDTLHTLLHISIMLVLFLLAVKTYAFGVIGS